MLFKHYDHNKNHNWLIIILEIETNNSQFRECFCYIHKNTFLAFKIKYMKCKYHKYNDIYIC